MNGGRFRIHLALIASLFSIVFVPSAYAKSPRGQATVHWGADRPAHLLIPELT